MLNIAIIGVSGYAKYVLESFLPLAKTGEVSFVAATIINPAEERVISQILRDLGCVIFPDYRLMLEAFSGRIDLCLVPTGIAWHRQMSKEALNHGAHVLVEKPLAGCVDDARDIIDTTHRVGRRVAVGFQDLCSEPILEVKRRIISGEIGRVTRVVAIGVWPRDFAYYRRNAWAGRLRQDGEAVFDSPLNNAFGHLLNLTLFFTGARFESPAEPMDVQGHLYRTYPIESFDTASIHVMTGQQVPIDCYVSHAAETEVSPRLVVVGNRGRIEWSYEKEICLYDLEEDLKWSTSLPTAQELRMLTAKRMVRAFSEGEVLINSAESAFAHVKVIEKLHLSSVIEDIPKELIVKTENGLAIAGAEMWLTECFEQGRPLLLEQLTDLRPSAERVLD